MRDKSRKVASVSESVYSLSHKVVHNLVLNEYFIPELNERFNDMDYKYIKRCRRGKEIE